MPYPWDGPAICGILVLALPCGYAPRHELHWCVPGDQRSGEVKNASRPVRAGVIGCGAYATGIVTQFPRVPSLEVSVVADTDLEAARRAYRLAGLSDDDIVVCDDSAAIARAIEAGKHAVTENALAVVEAPVDVVVESTGVPAPGALHARKAIESGKHVAMVNKETDVTVGPILKHLADRNGVVYCMADGDQPGLLIGLVAWARSLGVEVVCGGKALDDELCFDPLTGTVTTRYSGSTTLSDRQLEAVKPTNSPGDSVRVTERSAALAGLVGVHNSDLVEMVVAANWTGLGPDVPSLHGPTLYTSEIPRVLCERTHGGLLSARGRIDAVACIRMPHEAGLGGGVFVVVDGVNEQARRNLLKSPVRIDDHPVSLITRPYHLLGLDSIRTVVCAGRDGVATAGGECLPRYDVFVRARRDLKEGERFGHIRGGRADGADPAITNDDLEAYIGPAVQVREGSPLPIHLLDGNRLAMDVGQGAVITRDMVVPPSDSSLWDLRAEQDRLFLG